MAENINLYETPTPNYFDLYLNGTDGSVGNSSTITYNVELRVRIQKKTNQSSISAQLLGFMICNKNNNAPGLAIGTAYKKPTHYSSDATNFSPWNGTTLTENKIYKCAWTGVTFTEELNNESTYYIYLLYGVDGNMRATANAIYATGSEIKNGNINIGNLVIHSWISEISNSPIQESTNS